MRIIFVWASLCCLVSGTLAQPSTTNTAQTVRLDRQIAAYAAQKNYSAWAKLLIKRVERFGPYNTFGIKSGNDSLDLAWNYNSNAWDMFEHSSDKKCLRVALGWSRRALDLARAPDASFYDTYANLLHKLGRTKEAIHWEQKVLVLVPGEPTFIHTLETMKAGQPTWPVL